MRLRDGRIVETLHRVFWTTCVVVCLSSVPAYGKSIAANPATATLEVTTKLAEKAIDKTVDGEKLSLYDLGGMSNQRHHTDWIRKKYGIELIEGSKSSDKSKVKVKRIPVKGKKRRVVYHGRYDKGKQASPEQVAAMIREFNPKLRPSLVSSVSKDIHRLSHSYGIDPRLMVSIVAVESSFNPRAVSRTGAIGLGQLKPATARWLGVRNPYNMSQNLYGVAKYLRYLLDRYHGNQERAVAAYYRGQGHVDRKGIDPGARYYVGKVNKVYAQL